MAYVEVWKEGKLITRRQVSEGKGLKGCRIQLGSAGQVRLKAGETANVGKYEVRMFAGDISNYLNGKPLLARAPSRIYLLRKKISKYQRRIFIAVAVAVVFVGIVLFAYFSGVQSGAKVKVAQKGPGAQRKITELEPKTPGKNERLVSLANGAAENTRPTPEMLYGRRFRFIWRVEKDSGNNGIATLNSDGTISGIPSPNETFWLIDEQGRLIFKHRDGRVSSIFTHVNQRDGRWFFSGPFQFIQGVEHLLMEVVSETLSGPPAKNADFKSESAAGPVLPDNLKRGLVLHFNFDSEPVDGIFPDLSGQGNDGVAVNVQWIADGHREGSARFGLTKSYITVSNNALLNPPQLTLAAWIKTSYKDWVWRRIFDKGTGQGYVLSMCGDDKGKSYRGEVDIEPGKTWAHSGIQVTDGRWHHVAGTFDGMDAKIYVDGRPAGKPAHWQGKIPNTAYDLTIGANRSNPDPNLGEVDASFNGMMDDVMMFNFALSAEEVRALFDLQRRAEDGVALADGAAVNATK